MGRLEIAARVLWPLPMLLLSMLALGGCQRTAPPAEGHGNAAPVQAAQGMCGAHDVLAALCTLCNPKLAPTFQQKGDWCGEHGLPESICPICHPERGGRPEMDVAIEDNGNLPPPHGLRVTLASPEVAEEAGIRAVEAARGTDESAVLATATIVADNARSALVNPTAAGVIREFLVEIGAEVRRGAPLVRIESAEVADARARLRAARARQEVAGASYEREDQLYARGISAEKDAQVAEQERLEAQAEVSAALAALEMIGASEGESGIYDLRAPIAGTVTRRDFTVGTLVHDDDPLFEIVDTSVLWAEIDVPEAQIGRVAPGQRVVIEAGPGRETFETTVEYISPVVDPRTRTVRVRAMLQNPGRALRANVYATAHIFARGGSSAVLVPREAVQDARGAAVVFVPVSAGEYETRHVSVSPAAGDLLAVTEGVRAGESVVVEGAFFLKTETLKESIGAGCCDVGTPH